MPADRQEDDRGGLERPHRVSAMPAESARRLAWRDWSWFEQDVREPSMVAEHRLPEPDGVAVRIRRPRCGQEGPVEHHVPVGGQGDGAFRLAREQLTDGHPSGPFVEDRPEAADEVREVGLVAVVQVLLARPQGRALDLRVGEQLGMLEEGVEDVEPEAVYAPVEPAADHRELGLLDRRVAAS